MSKVLLLHLSDIHFRTDKENPVTQRTSQIANSLLRFSGNSLRRIFIITTGDIANSGARDEYLIARQFYVDIQDHLREIFNSIEINFIFTPGNHDCDFSQDKTRSLALKSLLKQEELIDIDIETLAQIAAVQQNYFEFVNSLSVIDFDKPRTKLICDFKFDVGGFIINFRSLNSAWCSEYHESPGSLQFPTNLIDNVWPHANLTISLFHHVQYWFHPDNHVKLRAILEKNCHLILTGHQHTPHAQESKPLDSTFTSYQLEAGAIQAKNVPSRFSILEINLDSLEFDTHSFQFSQDSQLYEQIDSSPKKQLVKIQTLRNKEFALTPEFNDYITDPGTPFSHPNKKKILLDDLFVFPDLDSIKISSNGEKHIVNSENVIDKIINDKTVLISSKDGYGKTSLFKSTFKALFQTELFPICIQGGTIKTTDESGLSSLIENCIKNTYIDKTFEAWLSKPITKRCILLDDIHKTKFSTEGQIAIISHLSKFADIIVIFSSDIYNLELISTPSHLKSILNDFHKYAIKPFGLRLRNQLIRKWVSLETKYEHDQIQLEHTIDRLEHLVNSSLTNKLLPSTPFFVLSLIQTIESQKITQAPMASFGQIYEALVTASLSSISPEIPLDIKLNILAEFAYYLFQSDTTSTNESSLDSIINAYLLEYKISLQNHIARNILLNCGIIRFDLDQYSFKHSYSYCYFTAKALANRRLRLSTTATVSKSIENIITNAHMEDHSNILLFYIHLTKDESTIIRLLEESSQFYKDETPFLIPDDYKIFQEGTAPTLSFSVPDTSPKENKEQLYKRIDDHNNQKASEGEAQSDEEKEEVLAGQFNKAFKLIQLLGHILCYFPGSLPGATKEKLLIEAVSLTRRTMHFISSIMNKYRDDLYLFCRSTVQQKEPTADETSVINKANHAMHMIAFYCNQLAIKAISTSIGNEHIFSVFDDAFSTKNDHLLKLVRLELALRHRSDIPFREIQELKKDYETDACLKSLLQSEVAEFLYLHPCKQADRQRLSAMVGIKIRPTHEQKEHIPEIKILNQLPRKNK
jgi:hypothetical protein